MMNNIIRCVTISLLMLCLSACGTSPKTQFYVLNSEQGTSNKNKNLSVSIGIWKVKLPEMIDRPEVVTRIGLNTVKRADFHRWASDLSENVGLLIAKEVSYNLETEYVDIFPWATSDKFDYQVKVHIREFGGELGLKSELSGIYLVIDGKNKKVLVDKQFFFKRDVANNSYDSMISAMSQLVVQLSGEISNEVANQLASARQ